MLEIRNIHKQFGHQTALAKVNLKIAKGEFFSLLGPSGCGKSTLLRILAGFENATAGEILWNDQRIDQLPARARPFNMVFQRYALFPHLSVFDNVAFGLRVRHFSDGKIKTQVMDALALVGLTDFALRRPDTLSGGQSQRVALARAFVNQPACVLLDEPLSALDQKLREHMHTELRLLQKRLGMTFIFVTHDQEEALLLSDRIAVMNQGVIEQVSPPRELYESPKTIFCARFVGRRNELKGLVKNSQTHFDQFPMRGQWGSAASSEGPVGIFVRPENVQLGRLSDSAKNLNLLKGLVLRVIFRGQRSEVIVRLDGTETLIRALVDAPTNETASGWSEGDAVQVLFAAEQTTFFSRDSS